MHKPEIAIPLYKIENDLMLFIYEEQEKSLFEIEEEEALKNGESKYQLLEGRSYNYYFKNSDYQVKPHSGIVINSKRNDVSEGRITPNIYVGTLTLFISKKDDNNFEYPIYLEVLATKMGSGPDESYRENYRFMLESITKKCTELLMQINSPINQNFEIDFNEDNKTIYQRFAFVQTLINSNEFNEAVQKIMSSPTTKWKEDAELKDVRSLRKLNSYAIRQLVTKSNRLPLPDDHYLTKQYGIKDIPSKIISTRKVETLDTPENRFIKHAIEVFLKFCEDCENYFANKKYLRPQKEALAITNNLRAHLNNSFFKEISTPITLRLNSPVLQRKNGYREILKAWLMFDLAAKLIWAGGENVYKAGKRDIAVLYEYWLFFTLYDLLKNKFNLDKHTHEDKPYDHLIVPTNDGLNVMVKSGKHTALEGIFDSGNRKLNIKFSYNRTFSGGKDYDKRVSGSWTKSLRPDYTLSIWPSDTQETVAEERELIVHIHFDSKYKVDHFSVKHVADPDLTEEEKNLEEEKILNDEKTEERKGNFKNADLLKMHAYKDAIRRSGGAYILYPGTENQIPLRGFHEIIPGLGAFAIRPSESNNGVGELSDFIDTVINHFLDRASQRENIASKTYNIYKDPRDGKNILNEPIPEYIGENKLIPDETFVLLGFYNKPEHLKWYKQSGLYNFRVGTGNGSLELTSEVANAKFLLLHAKDDKSSNEIWKITSGGPKIYSKNDLLKKGYPTEPSQDFYLVLEVEKLSNNEFNNAYWDFKKLNGYQTGHQSATPIAVSLTDLMKTKT
jgi:predicted component of viral defense system (DUF524 family)